MTQESHPLAQDVVNGQESLLYVFLMCIVSNWKRIYFSGDCLYRGQIFKINYLNI